MNARLTRTLRRLSITLIGAVLMVCGVATSASASTALLDPGSLMSALAPDQVTPTSDQVSINQSPTTSRPQVRNSERVAEAAPSFTVSAKAFESTTPVTLDKSLTFVRQTGEYAVYADSDVSTATYAKPTPDGAQIIFATSNRNQLASFKIGLDIDPSTVETRTDGSLFADQANGDTLFVRAPWARDAKGASLPTHYEVSGGYIMQKVEVTGSTVYPVLADPAWDYTSDYGIGSTTPEVAQLDLHGCFNCSFPVPEAPRNFPSAGQHLPLTVGPWSFACTFRNEDYRPIPGHHAWGYVFDAATGHVDGLGSWISFDFWKKSGESTYTLRVYGYIVNDNPTGLGRPAYLTGATAEWYQFAQNMTNVSIIT